MEAIALYKFDATQDDELSFPKGAVLKVRNMEDENWFQAELDGKKGFVPSTYIQMERHDWYKGKISRSEAEAFLLRTNPSGSHVLQDGNFIIRDCESDKNQFSLSVKHGSFPQHFKILSSGDGSYYLWPNKTFCSINKLIDYHRSVSIAREASVTILLRDMDECEMYQAMHEFKPEAPGEVHLRKGDRIQLLEKSDENWWTGIVTSTKEKGLFPATFVKKI